MLSKGLLAALLALAGFVGAHLVIGRALEARPDLRLLPGSVEAQKFEHFRQHADEYDVVYVGTSRVYRGFDPSVFDATLAELGHPLRSYNFGMVAMGYLEERYVVDWILALRPARLRWLLIEPTVRAAPWVARPIVRERESGFTLRDVLWHTPAVTENSLEATWNSSRDVKYKLQFTRSHLLHGLHRFCNIGVGSGLLSRAFTQTEEIELLPAGFGGHEAGAADELNEMRIEGEPEPTAPSHVPWQVLGGLVAEARSAGVEAVFAIPPTRRPVAHFEAAHARGALPRLLLFPVGSFPELVADRGAYYYDPDHLNTRGAALFTRRLATQFAALLEPER